MNQIFPKAAPGAVPPVLADIGKAEAPGALKRDPSDMSIGTGNFTQGVPAFWFARAVDPGSMETLYTPYRDSVYVRRAIKNVSGPISSVDLVFSKPKTDAAFRRVKGDEKKLYTPRGIVRREPDTEVDLPQFRQFLREPMKGLVYEDFVEASLGWYMMQECFWLVGDRVKKPFPEVDKSPFEPIIVPRPDQMRPLVERGGSSDRDEDIVAWQYTDRKGRVWNLDPAQVIRLMGWNPYDPHRGLGDYPSASVAAESHWLAGKFKRQLTSDNDTAPIISAKNGTPTDTQMDQIKMQLAERRANKFRGKSKTLFLPGEVDVHDPKILSVDAAFIAGMLEDRHEIFMAFGNPPSLADVKAAYSIGSASDGFVLIFNTCIPVGNKFCAVMERLIKALTGEDVEVGLDWDEHYVMQQVRSERMKDADSLFAKGMPMQKISEHLRLNLPRFKGDDVGYLPINVVPAQSQDEITATQPTADDYSETPSTGDDNNDDSPDDNEPEEIKAMLTMLRDGRGGQNGLMRTTPENEALWKSHMRVRSKSVKLIQSKASKVFNDYRVTALRKLESSMGKMGMGRDVNTRALVDVIFDPKMFGVDLVKGLDPAIQATLQTAGDELFDEIGKPDDPWKMPPQAARDFINGREKLIKEVGTTARNQLNTALQEGIDAGESTDQLADRVRSVFNNLSKYEAKRIAMTETSAAYGFARHKAMSDAGVQYKSWLSSHGPNVRPAHRAAELKYGPGAEDPGPIPISQAFVVMGENLMYPGDPNGSAGNVINCQCIQLAVPPPKKEAQP